MNADFLGLLCAALLCLGAPVHAEDRLWTDPGVLAQGNTLPGDSGPIPPKAVAAIEPSLSLLDAVDLALNHNAQLKESWAKIKIQSAALGKANSALWPTLSGTVSRVGDRLDYPGYPISPQWLESYQASATADWPVFSFGSGWFRQVSAEHLLESAVLDQDAALQQALDTVIQDYYDAYAAQEVELGDRRDEDLAKRTLDSARRREAKGVGTREDSLQAHVALLKLVLQDNRDQGAYAKALALLIYDMGVPADTRVNFPDDFNPDLRYSGGDLESWLSQARANHPAILSAQKQLQAAGAAVAAAVADALPSLDLSVNYYRNGRPDMQLSSASSDEVLAMATVNFPLFNGFSDLYAIRSAKAQAEEQMAALRDVRDTVLREVVKSYQDTQAAFRNLQASEDLLQASEDAFTASRLRFDKGATDLVEVLNAQTALADARRQRVQCLADWRSARLRLVASAGRLNRAELEQ